MDTLNKYKKLLGLSNPNEILPKTRVNLLLEDDYLYFLCAPCGGESIKKFYYSKVERIKNRNDAIGIIDHIKNMREDNLNKIISDTSFLTDIIEGITFDFDLDHEKDSLVDYLNYKRAQYNSGGINQ